MELRERWIRKLHHNCALLKLDQCRGHGLRLRYLWRLSKTTDSIGLEQKPAGLINRKRALAKNPSSSATERCRVEYWPIERLKPYERNPRKNDKAATRIREIIREFGFAVPILAKSDGEVIDGHLRLKGALAEKPREVPVVPWDGWTDAQVKAFRLMVNRSVSWADWDLDALALEFGELRRSSSI